MKTSLPYQFLAVWMSLVCYLSPIYLFTDAHLLPKWYLCLLGLAVTGMVAALFAGVLWLTQSRTGLICLALYGIIGLGLVVRRYIRQKLLRWGIYGVTVVVMLAGTSAYVASRKTDSTSGRAFILSRSWELVKEHPIIGHGHRGFEREYMLRQADFFKENPDSEYAVLADEIRHPNNYHQWVSENIREINKMSNMNQTEFIRLFQEKVIIPVSNNPDMLYKRYWE